MHLIICIMNTFNFGLYNGSNLVASVSIETNDKLYPARDTLWRFVAEMVALGEWPAKGLYLNMNPIEAEYTSVSAMERIYG